MPITIKAVARASAVAQSSAITVADKRVWFTGRPVCGFIVCEIFLPST